MRPEGIDYQAKIIAPTQQLYHELSSQADELFEQAKESAVELHAKLAESSMELYQHPVATATRWQAEASEKGNELYSSFNNDIIPSVKADYQQLASTLSDYGIQLQTALQVFLDNPEQVTAEAFTTFNQALIVFIDKTMTTSATLLDEIGQRGNEIIELLVDQPMQTMENIYYDSLTALLNSYFELISSLLVSI